MSREASDEITRRLTRLFFDDTALEFQCQIRQVLDAKDSHAKSLEDANRQLALELVAVRERIKKIATSGDGSYFPAIKVLLRDILNTPTQTIVEQIERRLEAAGKMAEALLWARDFIKGQFPNQDLNTLHQIEEARALWNTANAGGK